MVPHHRTTGSESLKNGTVHALGGKTIGRLPRFAENISIAHPRSSFSGRNCPVPAAGRVRWTR